MSVSLVVSTYLNGPDSDKRVRSIHATMASLECQTYRNWDALIVHNGPVMPESAKKLLKGCPLINQINWAFADEEKGQWGHPYRREAALRTTGEYVGFVNDDGYYAPTYLERLVELLSSGADLAYCNFIHGFTEKVDDYQPYGPVLAQPYIGGIDVSGWLAKRWLIEITDWTDYSKTGDGAYVEKLITKTNKVAKTQQFLYVHN